MLKYLIKQALPKAKQSKELSDLSRTDIRNAVKKIDKEHPYIKEGMGGKDLKNDLNYARNWGQGGGGPRDIESMFTSLLQKGSENQQIISPVVKQSQAYKKGQMKGAIAGAVTAFGGKEAYDQLTKEKKSNFETAFSKAHNAGKEKFKFEGKEYTTEVKKGKNMGGSILSRYDDGGMATPKVTEKEKEMYGEDAKKFTSLYNSYMQSKEKADTPEQMETIERRFKEVQDSFDGNAVGVAYRLMDEEKEGKMEGGMMKYAEGSMLVPPEMEMPVDTYDNIPEDEMAEAKASQLPDDEMEDKYLEYVLDESLDQDDQEYLMNALDGDERLSGIFDKVMDVAGEFSGEGEVEGLGTGVSDSIPARLSDGEFVFTKKATDQLGADKLQTMMDDAERAYDGGYMKKAFGGLTDSGTSEIEEEDEESVIRARMISADSMPSNKRR